MPIINKKNEQLKKWRWYEMGISDMPKKQPVITWIIRIVVGVALGSALGFVLTVPHLQQFKSQAQIVQPVNKVFIPQAAATATLSLSSTGGNFTIGEIFPVDIQLNTGGSDIVAVGAYLRYDKTKLEVDPSFIYRTRSLN